MRWMKIGWLLFFLLFGHRVAEGDVLQLLHVADHPVVKGTAFPDIKTLHAWGGRIYMGTGDWIAHPGPTTIVSYEPVSKKLVAEFSAGTDSIETFRTLGDTLVAVSVDPVHFRDFADYSVRSNGQWASRAPLGMMHPCDMLASSDGAWWMVGSKVENETASRGATAYRSLDAGATWEELRPPGVTDTRFYWCFEHEGRVCVDGYAFDGAAWESVPALGRYIAKPTRVLGPTGSVTVVALSSRSGWGDLLRLSATGKVTLRQQVRDFAAAGSEVYALSSQGGLYSCSDVAAPAPSWSFRSSTGLGSGLRSSIAVLDGTMYIGTTNGELWAASLAGDALDFSDVSLSNALPDWFGYSLSLSGDRLAVGAPRASGGALEAGRVHIFGRDACGVWENEEELAAPTTYPGGYFGSDVGLSGDYLAVLAAGMSTTGEERGDAARIYLYERAAGAWWLRQTLTNAYAHSVSVEPPWLAVGCTHGAEVYRLSAGSPVVATYAQTVATNVSWLYSPSAAVRLDAGRLAVGMCGDLSRAGGEGAVAVYAYDASPGEWQEEALLTRPAEPGGFTTNRPDAFGWCVALDGPWLAVGAPRDDEAAGQAGAVCLYERVELPGGSIEYEPRGCVYAPAPGVEQGFGVSVSLRGRTLLVGASRAWPRQDATGAVFEYRREGAAWLYRRTLWSRRGTGDGFLGAFSEQNTAGTLAAVAAVPADRRAPALQRLQFARVGRSHGTPYDFDGDECADPALYHEPPGIWYLLQSDVGFETRQFGWYGPWPTPADYDGDGTTDLALYYPPTGMWYIMASRDGFRAQQFGWDGPTPVCGDYDGDGAADIALYYQPEGRWYILQSRDGFSSRQFGWSAGRPVQGDYDGDGKDDLAVYGPGGMWYVMQSRDGFLTRQFGWDGPIPVPADYDGDTKTDQALYDPPTGMWYISGSEEGLRTTQFGWNGPAPVPADYDGDGRIDPALYFPPTGMWYMLQSATGFTAQQFGWSAPIPCLARRF